MNGIQNPFALIIVPLLIGLAWLAIVRDRKRAERFRMLGLSGTTPTSSLALLVPCVLMTVAMLRPYWGSSTVIVPAASRDYMFVVDVSRSMFARDVPPSRIELAKRKMRDLIDEFTRIGAPHRYGITLFAGHSYLLCPVTDDLSVLKQFISEISPSMVTSLGSNLEAGISTALARFTNGDSHNTRLLILSDGEDDQLSLTRITGQISDKKIRVDVLGIGTLEGSTIQLEDGTLVHDKTSRVVSSKLGEESLKAIATAGSGIYMRASLDDRDIREFARSSLSLEKNAKGRDRTVTIYQEFGSWLALLALLTLMVAVALPNTSALMRALVFTVMTSHVASATPISASPSEGATGRAAYDLYQAGRYEEASKTFKAALENSSDDPVLIHGYASALFKEGKFKEANEIFKTLASKAQNGRERFESLYNQGTSLLKLKEYRGAIDAFEKSLQIKPDDERALHNKEVAQALLEEEERKAKEPTPIPTPTLTGSPQASSTPPPQGSPPPDASPQAQQSPDSSQSQSGSNTPTPSSESKSTENQKESSVESTPSPAAENSEAAPTRTPPKDTAGTRSKEDQPHIDSQLEQRPVRAEPTRETVDPSTKEAQSWIESLPESPLLIRRDRGPSRQEGQTW